MSNSLSARLYSTLPALGGSFDAPGDIESVAVAPASGTVGGGGEASTSAMNDSLQASIAQLIASLTQALAGLGIGSAAAVAGGGASAASSGAAAISEPDDLNEILAAGANLGGDGSAEPAFELIETGAAGAPTTAIGGGAAVSMTSTPVTSTDSIMPDVAIVGGTGDSGLDAYVDTTAITTAAVDPETSTAPAVVDMRRVVGTPQPGGIVATLLARAVVSAPMAMSEGTWRVLTDGAGTQLQVHGHGRWATASNDQILAGLQAGQIAVHLHPDGTLHLHDVM